MHSQRYSAAQVRTDDAKVGSFDGGFSVGNGNTPDACDRFDVATVESFAVDATGNGVVPKGLASPGCMLSSGFNAVCEFEAASVALAMVLFACVEDASDFLPDRVEQDRLPIHRYWMGILQRARGLYRRALFCYRLLVYDVKTDRRKQTEHRSKHRMVLALMWQL